MIRPKIRKLIRTEWKQRSTVDSVSHTHYTRRLSNCDQQGSKRWVKLKQKNPKESRYAGLKAEFKKIVWPDKKSLTKETTAVVIVSVILGLIIALMDYIIPYGVDFLVKL